MDEVEALFCGTGITRPITYTCAARTVLSDAGMTADRTPLPYDVLQQISSRIVKEVRGINWVVYDITSKPRYHRVGAETATELFRD